MKNPQNAVNSQAHEVRQNCKNYLLPNFIKIRSSVFCERLTNNTKVCEDALSILTNFRVYK